MGRGQGSGCLVPEARWVSSEAREGLKVTVCPKGSLTRELVSHAREKALQVWNTGREERRSLQLPQGDGNHATGHLEGTGRQKSRESIKTEDSRTQDSDPSSVP